MTNKDIVKYIKNAKNVALFAHKNPDPDAYGSMFGMREICQNLGINATIFAQRNSENNLDYLFPLNEVKTDFKAKDFDLVIIMDAHCIRRLAPIFIEEVGKAKKIIVIDHHEVTEEEKQCLASKQMLNMPHLSSICEMLTLLMLENKLEITPKMATYLYVGLIGDTNRFLNSNLTPQVFDVAKTLYECQANIEFVYDVMYRSLSGKHLRAYQYFVKNVKVLEKGQVAYTVFDLNSFKKLNLDHEDVKFCVDEMKNMKDVKVSFLFMEFSKNNYRVSMRSVNGFNTVICSGANGGGGHKLASAFDKKFKKKEIEKFVKIWGKKIVDEK